MLADVGGVLPVVGTVDAHHSVVVKAVVVLVMVMDLADNFGFHEHVLNNL